MELDPGLEARSPRRLANPRWRLITSPCRITISKPAATDEAIVGEWTHPVDWLPSDDENRSLPATCSAQSINDESVVRTLACSHGDRNDPTSSDCGTPSESSDVSRKRCRRVGFPRSRSTTCAAPGFARAPFLTPDRRASNGCCGCRARRPYPVRTSPPDRWWP
jgi:hypothetical protein